MSDVTAIMLQLAEVDPQVRNNAEQIVQNAKENDLAGFLVALIQELRDETKPETSRRMAGVVLKNSVALNLHNVEAREELESKWKNLSAEVRATVKGEALATLATNVKQVRLTAALVIANLARIELPANEWPDLINILVSAGTSGNEQHMEASLTTLGYICEESNQDENVENVLQNFSGPILNAVCQGMGSSNTDVKYYATNALCNAMEFIHSSMSQDDQRDYLVGAVCETATNCADERTRVKAMECLVKVAELYYSTLPKYIDSLFQLTMGAIRNDCEDVGLQAMQFWIAICDTEKEMKSEPSEAQQCLDYAMQGNKILVDLCTEFLQRQEEGQTEDDWNLSVAAGKLLQTLAECIGYPVVETTMPFVYSKIEEKDWRQREAALMAFGCIIGGPDPKAIEDTVSQGIPGLLQYVRDTNPMVADTSGWVLSTVCELFPDAFLCVPTNLQQLLNIMGPMISGESTMAIRACNVVQNLALAYEDEEDQITNELSPFFQDIVLALLTTIDRQDSDKLRVSGQEALNCLIDAAASDCFNSLRSLIPEIGNRLRHLINLRKQGNTNEELLFMQGLMCGSLGAVAKKLGSEMVTHCNDIIGLLIDIFQQQSDTVQDEALVVIGSLAHAVNTNFEQYLPQVMPFLLTGINNINEMDLCHIAIGVIGDIASAMKQRFTSHCQDVMMSIVGSLENPEVSRDLKCSLIGCLGDIALNIGPGFQPYLAKVMTILSAMEQASRTLNFKGDLDTEDYVMSLWEVICNFFTSVSQGFKENCESLLPYFSGMLEFIMFVAPAASSQEDVFSVAVSAIGDLANVLSESPPHIAQQAKSFLLTDSVYNVVREAQRRKDEATVDAGKWAMKQLTALERC